MAGKTTTIQIRFDDDLFNYVDAEANYLKITRSSFIRNLVRAHRNQSTVMVDAMIEEQAKLNAEMLAMKENINGLGAILPVIFAMVKVATYSDDLKAKFAEAAEVGRGIMNKAKSTT